MEAQIGKNICKKGTGKKRNGKKLEIKCHWK